MLNKAWLTRLEGTMLANLGALYSGASQAQVGATYATADGYLYGEDTLEHNLRSS